MDIRQQVEKETAQVPSNCEQILDAIPNEAGKAACSKHGEFEFKYVTLFGGKVLCSSCCQKCVAERNLFIDEEVKRREDEKRELFMQNKVMNSGVSKRNVTKTFSTFIAQTKEQSKAKDSFMKFANSVCKGEIASNLIVCGSVGVGKTHLASSCVDQIIRSGKSCEVIKIIDLIRDFKRTWSKDCDQSEQNFLKYYTNLPALIIDEVGVQFGSDTEKMVVFDIIDGRYNNMLPTVLISNLALPDVQELIGDRAIDRLREDGGIVVAMKWDSYRGKL